MTPSEIGFAWIISKIAALFAGLFAGLGLSLFWTPDKLQEKGRTAAIFLSGGISGGAALILTAPIQVWLGIPIEDLDKGMVIALAIGVCSVAAVNWVANFIRKRQHLDAAQIIKEGRKIVGGKEADK